LAGLALAGATSAQTKSAADNIAEYRAMPAEGNPAELFEARGEAVWKTRRGPLDTTLEACDLSQGPVVMKGAFVALPRYDQTLAFTGDSLPSLRASPGPGCVPPRGSRKVAKPHLSHEDSAKAYQLILSKFSSGVYA
jgi:hypothetical protein